MLILDVDAFKIIQMAVKQYVMGVVTWQFLEHQCIRLEYLAAGQRQVQLGRILLSRMEKIDNVVAAVAEGRRDICISWILLKACNCWNFCENRS